MPLLRRHLENTVHPLHDEGGVKMRPSPTLQTSSFDSEATSLKPNRSRGGGVARSLRLSYSQQKRVLECAGVVKRRQLWP